VMPSALVVGLAAFPVASAVDTSVDVTNGTSLRTPI
jgi:hypothetical protein